MLHSASLPAFASGGHPTCQPNFAKAELIELRKLFLKLWGSTPKN